MSTKRPPSDSPASNKKPKTEKDDVPKTPREVREVKEVKGPKELTKGARWMIDQIDLMRRHHMACLMTATAIIQFKNYAKQLRMRNPKVPVHLSRRLESHWEAYESIRRHIEWYMSQNALHASTPSRPIPIANSPMNSMVPPPVAAVQTEVPKASPIPLSTASMLAYENHDNPSTAGNATNGTGVGIGTGVDGNPTAAPGAAGGPSGTSGTAAPGLPPLPANPNESASRPVQPLGMYAGRGINFNSQDSQMDLSSLGMEELTALLGGGDSTDNSSFTNMNQTTQNQAGQSAQAGQGQPGGQNQAQPGQTTLLGSLFDQSNGGTGTATGGFSSASGEPTDTDKLLASLSQTQGSGNIQSEIDNLGFDFSAMGDTSEMDINELVGLFGANHDAGSGNGDINIELPTETTTGGTQAQQQSNTDSAQAPSDTNVTAGQAATKTSATTANTSGQANEERPKGDRENTPAGHIKRNSIGVGGTPKTDSSPSTAKAAGQPSTAAKQQQQPSTTAATDGIPDATQTTTTATETHADSAAGKEGSKQPEQTPAQTQAQDQGQGQQQDTQNQAAEDDAGAAGGDYDLSNIDLDDFNFGNMPTVEGDEFESLFAEFK